MQLTKTSIALAAFLAGCGATAVASQLVIPSARAGTNPTRWEYLCMREGGGNAEAFNRAGAEGWELTTVSGSVWCFKRQLP